MNIYPRRKIQESEFKRPILTKWPETINLKRPQLSILLWYFRTPRKRETLTSFPKVMRR